ncbi:MAG: thiamine-binding protein [Flavobacteriaceae bacterium]|nr:thiamine-binding protein [Flavobacteriaceae bacterium]
MKVSIDLSMYPLQKDFEKPIKDFIKILRASKFHTEENGLSTQIYGEYLEVTAFINSNIHEALLKQENCVFIMKIVTDDRSDHEPDY